MFSSSSLRQLEAVKAEKVNRLNRSSGYRGKAGGTSPGWSWACGFLMKRGSDSWPPTVFVQRFHIFCTFGNLLKYILGWAILKNIKTKTLTKIKTPSRIFIRLSIVQKNLLAQDCPHVLNVVWRRWTQDRRNIQNKDSSRFLFLNRATSLKCSLVIFNLKLGFGYNYQTMKEGTVLKTVNSL